MCERNVKTVGDMKEGMWIRRDNGCIDGRDKREYVGIKLGYARGKWGFQRYKLNYTRGTRISRTGLITNDQHSQKCENELFSGKWRSANARIGIRIRDLNFLQNLQFVLSEQLVKNVRLNSQQIHDLY